jgi:hypothetical protein
MFICNGYQIYGTPYLPLQRCNGFIEMDFSPTVLAGHLVDMRHLQTVAG